MSRGIDYGRGLGNIDKETGIRYGVIPAHAVDWWHEGSEVMYPPPSCPDCGDEVVDQESALCPDECEKEYYCSSCEKGYSSDECEATELSSIDCDKEGLKATQGNDSPDIFVLASPYFTRAAFCSPCAPGACYLTSPCEDGERAYCFGPEWYEEGKAPYPIYNVSDGKLVGRWDETKTNEEAANG